MDSMSGHLDRRIHVLLVIGALLALPASAFAQSAKVGHAIPFNQVQFHESGTDCDSSAVEWGNPHTGPSTIILKASPDCVVPWHYHTAEEQLMVAAGAFLTEMEGEAAARLEAGGFAVMPGGRKHQFSCRSSTTCVAFITFNQKYDIVWVDKKSSYIDKSPN